MTDKPDTTGIDARWPHLAADIVTLRNGGADDPNWTAVTLDDGEGKIEAAWNIWVADGQICCTVPAHPFGGGEPSDGGPLTDWRDAICRAGRTLTEMRAELAQARADLEAAQERLTWPRWMEAWDGSFGLVPPDGGSYLAIVTPEDGMWRPWLGLGCRDRQSPGGFDEAEAYLVQRELIRPGCTIRPAGVPR